MRKSILINPVFILLTLALFSGKALPQDTKPQETATPAPKADTHYYHLEFVLKELSDNGNVVNSRIYHTSVSTNGRSVSVRTGTKIPVRTNDKGGDFQYIDVGVNLDCGQAQETAQGLSLQISAEISSLANASGASEAIAPIVRQNRWSSYALVPIGKPTVVFSSDNLENKGRMQVEVTATPAR
jgi:hypothetical protein